jgi:hypothetical protein
MTVGASRSCLGLEACVGSAIRQIVDARVLLTATVPPALPGRSETRSTARATVEADLTLLAEIKQRFPEIPVMIDDLRRRRTSPPGQRPRCLRVPRQAGRL